MRFLRSWRPAACAGLALLAGTAPAHAGGGVAFGVRAALSISGIASELDYAPENKFGPGGGVFLTFGVSDLFSVQPELLYVTKGASWGESAGTDQAGNPTGTFETLVALDYLEVPVLLRLTPPIGSVVRPVLVAGPSVAFELSEKLKTTGSSSASYDTDGMRAVDFGAAFGLGLELVGGGGIWSLDTRYTLGLADLDESPLGDSDIRNRDLIVSLGFARSIR